MESKFAKLTPDQQRDVLVYLRDRKAAEHREAAKHAKVPDAHRWGEAVIVMGGAKVSGSELTASAFQAAIEDLEALAAEPPK